MKELVFIVLHNFFLPEPAGVMDDMFWMDRKRQEIRIFQDKSSLEDFVKSSCGDQKGLNDCEIYEGKMLDYKVTVEKKDIQKTVTESVEVKREVEFK